MKKYSSPQVSRKFKVTRLHQVTEGNLSSVSLSDDKATSTISPKVGYLLLTLRTVMLGNTLCGTNN